MASQVGNMWPAICKDLDCIFAKLKPVSSLWGLAFAAVSLLLGGSP